MTAAANSRCRSSFLKGKRQKFAALRTEIEMLTSDDVTRWAPI
jgi:hypothetical protein